MLVDPQPLHIFIDNPPNRYQWLFSWLPAITIALSALTFWLGYRKRVRERQATWYHKVVVDFAVAKIFEVFEIAEEEFGNPLVDLPQDRLRKTIPRKYTIALAKFSDALVRMQDAVHERLIVFDEKSALELITNCQDLQDEVTDWFESAFIRRKRDPGLLRSVMLKREKSLFRILYDCEFKQF